MDLFIIFHLKMRPQTDKSLPYVRLTLSKHSNIYFNWVYMFYQHFVTIQVWLQDIATPISHPHTELHNNFTSSKGSVFALKNCSFFQTPSI